MTEQIEEYLKSCDEDVVAIGYELLKGLKIPFEQKNQIMHKCGMTTSRYYQDSSKSWWRTDGTFRNGGYRMIWVAPFNWEEQ